MIKPKTRKEKLLSAIANDTPVTLQPKNREEIFLAQIAEKVNIVNAPVAESISEEANVLVEDGGAVKRTPYSWNTLNGRPFGESPTGGDTLTWDGNTEGLEYIEVEIEGEIMPIMFKLSDSVVTNNDFANGVSVTLRFGEESISATVPLEELQTSIDEFGIVVVNGMSFVTEDNYQIDFEGLPIIFPTAGIWHIAPVFQRGGYISAVTFPGYTGFPSVTPISETLLPESVKRVVVNVTLGEDMTTATADKTLEEIEPLIDSGASAVASVDMGGGAKMFLPMLTCIAGASVAFGSVMSAGQPGVFVYMAIQIMAGGSVGFAQEELISKNADV